MILITGQYNIQGTLEKGQFLVQNVAAATEINGLRLRKWRFPACLVRLVMCLRAFPFSSLRLPQFWRTTTSPKPIWLT
nr:hypothetical protein [Alysiella crassa]